MRPGERRVVPAGVGPGGFERAVPVPADDDDDGGREERDGQQDYDHGEKAHGRNAMTA